MPLLAIVAAATAAAAWATGSPLRSGAPSRSGTSSPGGATSFRTGIGFAGGESRRLAQAGVQVVRVPAVWSQIAPGKRPAGFDPRNPADPAYNWTDVDQQVKEVAAEGLTPIVMVLGAPTWAQNTAEQQWNYTNWLVDPKAFAEFATAIATRYDGSFHGLPRVRYWEAWDEPNLAAYYNPQYAFTGPRQSGGFRFMDPSKPVAAIRYRTLVNDFADAVHAVRRDNLVLAGGMAPFSGAPKLLKWGGATPPLKFMEWMLCMSGGAHPHPTCNTQVHFDVWDHHPYTSGDPTHKATNPDDVSLGNLPEMKALLDAAWKAHHIVAARPPLFWVTEFSYDTNPPDPKAVPIHLQARWTSEALYQMWNDGVSLVVWLQLCDSPFPQGIYQSGLWFNGPKNGCGKPKPTLTAFRFPFVAYRRGGGVYVWGRTPGGESGLVYVQQRVGAQWKTLTRLRGDASGVFSATVTPVGGGPLRAHVRTDTSLAFSLHVPPDHFYYPFGTH